MFDLIRDMYDTSASGASQRVREVVAAVRDLKDESSLMISVSMVGERLGLNKMTVSRRVKLAVENGWLTRNSNLPGVAAALELGEPLPSTMGLPTPESIAAECNGVTPKPGSASAGTTGPGMNTPGC